MPAPSFFLRFFLKNYDFRVLSLFQLKIILKFVPKFLNGPIKAHMTVNSLRASHFFFSRGLRGYVRLGCACGHGFVWVGSCL